MPLPKKTIRVLPNPWAFVHPEHGPSAVCHRDTGGRGSAVSYIGAEIDPQKTQITEQRPETDPRHNRQVTVFRYPALNSKLDGPAPEFPDGIELPKSPYSLDRLRDGDLVPADEATARAFPCRFRSLSEARAAGIAQFDALYGPGSFAEAFPHLAEPSPDLRPMRSSSTGGDK